MDDRVLYFDFTKVPNKLLDNIGDYSGLYILKSILSIIYIGESTSDQICDLCGINNKQTLTNVGKFLVDSEIAKVENKKIFLRNDFFNPQTDASPYYYQSITFTMIPNKFFKEDLAKINTIGELKVLLYFFRETLGWQKNKTRFNLNQVCSSAKLSKTSATAGVKANIEAGRLLVIDEGNAANGGTEYALSIDNGLKEKKPKLIKKENTDEPDYVFRGIKYWYPKSRRGDKSWRKIDPEHFTYQHVLDSWIEMCYVKKNGQQPHRRDDWLKYNAIIKSVKARGFTPLEFKWALGYCYNFIMKEKNKNPEDVQFYMLGDCIGLSRKNNIGVIGDEEKTEENGER